MILNTQMKIFHQINYIYIYNKIIQAIDNLENKNSFGDDGISYKLLKFIKDEIISSLTL